jgi:hypothetical protein
LASFFDGNFLDGGLTAAQEEKVIAALGGATVNSDVITRIKSYDGSNNLLGVVATLNLTQNGSHFPSALGYGSPDVGLIFKQESDGGWRLYGNQQQANTSVQYEGNAYYPVSGSPLFSQSLNVALLVPGASTTPISPCTSTYASSATVSPSVAITGVDRNTGSTLTLEPSGYALTQESNATKLPGGSNACQFDASGDRLSLSAANLPALVGNTLSFSLNGGSPSPSLSQTISGYTTESVSFTTPSSHALSAAQLGQPLTVQWNPPATISVYQVMLSVTEAVAQQGGGEYFCEWPRQWVGLRSATITLPSVCASHPVQTITSPGPLPAAMISVTIYGSHGEVLGATWEFN